MHLTALETAKNLTNAVFGVETIARYVVGLTTGQID